MSIESWRRVWREGFAPTISVQGLQSLASALRTNDTTLVQGFTVKDNLDQPVDLFETDESTPACSACAVSYCGWKGDDLKTVGEVMDYFERSCFEADKRVGHGECREFLSWFDSTPRNQMIAELLPEVERELARRHNLDFARSIDEYKKEFDRILIGFGIPPELLEADSVGGGYSGRAIPG